MWDRDTWGSAGAVDVSLGGLCMAVGSGTPRPPQVGDVIDLRQMPGHSFPRNMYTSGHDLVQVLKTQVKRRPIQVVEDTMVTDLLTRDGQVVGRAVLRPELG